MKLIDAFLPVFSYISTLKESSTVNAHLFNDVRTDIERLLTESSVNIADTDYSEDQYDSARFAVVVYVDEVMLSLDWAGKPEWVSSMLQKQYYDIANGGTEFYERLEQLNPVNLSEKDIREVYFYSLCLGFSGKLFRTTDKAQKQKIIQSCHDLLFDSSRLNDSALFPLSSSNKTESQQIKRPINLNLLIIAIPILIAIGLFFSLKSEVLVESAKILGLF